MQYYYSEEKRKKENENKLKQELKDKVYQKKKQKQMPKLIENYEKRIKEFLFKMAGDPQEIMEMKQAITSTRKELFDEGADKILSTKGFIFNNFKTEKQRLQDYLKEKNAIYVKQNINQSNWLPNNPYFQIVQPTMRFKARTDLERVFEEISRNSFLEDERKIIEDQLKSLGLNTSRKMKSKKNCEEDLPGFVRARLKKEQVEAEEKQKEIHCRIIEDRKEMVKKRKCLHKVDNSQARFLRQELHNKTHFKAIEGFSLFKKASVLSHEILEDPSLNKQCILPNSQRNKPVDLKKSTFLEDKSQKYYNWTNPFTTYDTINSNTNYALTTPSNANSSQNYFLSQSIQELNQSPKYSLCSGYESFYNKKMPQSPKFNQYLSKEKLDELKKMAFAKDDQAQLMPKEKNKLGLWKELPNRLNSGTTTLEEEFSGRSQSAQKRPLIEESKLANRESILQQNPLSFFLLFREPEEMKKEDKIKIDGQVMSKNDLERISKKVLNKCNWIHQRNKNAKVMKAGDGKLMFTGGMTVQEFINKYGLI